MQRRSFEQTVRQILQEDSRYDAEAYVFMREALDFTVRALNKPVTGPTRHVTGRELQEGIRTFALQEFGPLAATVLRAWGVRQTEDFGNIVFNMVEKGILGKTESDRREDFANGYSFAEAFDKPFLPPPDATVGEGQPPHTVPAAEPGPQRESP